MARLTKLIIATLMLGALSSVAHADELIGEYRAYISRNDLYNSSGKRLTQPWQIIRQDRANYHRYNIRDEGDQYDDFFASAENRAIAERLIQHGTIERGAGADIVRGDVYIDVKIYGRGNLGESLDVTVE